MGNLQTVVAGDSAWRGIDLRTHPAELPEGILAGATNLRLVNGRAKPRGGVRFVQPPEPGANGLRYKGPFYHAAVFRPTDSHDRLALFCPGQVVLFNTLTGAAETSANWVYPSGETVTDSQELDWIQASGSGVTTDDAYLLRGLSNKVLRFRYTDTMRALDDYSVINTGQFPYATFGLYYQNRLAVASGPTQISVSDFLDFDAWSELAQYNVAKGGGDYLVAVKAFQGDKVVIFGRKSIWVAYFAIDATAGYTGSIDAETSWLRLITNQFGCVARRSVVEVGGSIFFLTDAGIAELNAVLDLNLLGGAEAISAPIQPVMDALNANGAGAACAVALRDRVFFALPVLGAVQTVTAATVASLGAYRVAALNLATESEAGIGEPIMVSGFVGVLAGLNGRQMVTGSSGFSVEFYTSVPATALAPVAGVTMQAAPTRPNRVAVLNTVNKAWESIDELPGLLRADFLLAADAGARREVWLVDRTYGPALYESGTQDMDGTYPSTGWPTLPQTLPFTLTAPTYSGDDVQASLTTRTLTWGDVTKAKKLRQGRARFRLNPADAAVWRLVARSPADETSTASVAVVGGVSDDTLRLPLGLRCVEAHLEVEFTNGAAAVETLTAEALVDVPEQANS